MNLLAYQSIFLECTALISLLGLMMAPLSRHLHHVFLGKTTRLSRILSPVENIFVRMLPIKAKEGMNWKHYTASLLISCLVVTLFLFIIMLSQGLEPQLALNIAISFVTTTNWQAYTPETNLSAMAQMMGITVTQFFGPAVGMAVLFAFVRSLIQKENASLGNYWVDMIRIILYVLLPISLILALILGFGGVVQTFQDHISFTNLSGAAAEIKTGPVASLSAIALLGNNGGGFFAAGWAHPFANPTAFTNFIGLFSMLLLPASLCFFFGRAVGDIRQGVAVFLMMFVLYATASAIMVSTQIRAHSFAGVETRLSQGSSALWAATTTSTSTGATSSDMSQLKPLSIATAMFMILTGEVAFGGAGTGVIGMLVYVLLSVFITGLMVGRSPEYLGNKIVPYDMKVLSLVLIMPLLLVLAGTVVMLYVSPGPHNLTTLLYGLASLTHNNGSSVSVAPFTSEAGLILSSCCMFLGRFFFLIPVLALAGSMANKKITPVTVGTLPTHTGLFIGVVIGTILLIGALSFLPAITLGPLMQLGAAS